MIKTLLSPIQCDHSGRSFNNCLWYFDRAVLALSIPKRIKWSNESMVLNTENVF